MESEETCKSNLRICKENEAKDEKKCESGTGRPGNGQNAMDERKEWSCHMITTRYISTCKNLKKHGTLHSCLVRLPPKPEILSKHIARKFWSGLVNILLIDYQLEQYHKVCFRIYGLVTRSLTCTSIIGGPRILHDLEFSKKSRYHRVFGEKTIMLYIRHC